MLCDDLEGKDGGLGGKLQRGPGGGRHGWGGWEGTCSPLLGAGEDRPSGTRALTL